ncbi:MAG: hypothetical protein RL385_593 [Pseudomonadota bacterium]|jgi:DNA-binding winged helix-turn-helix (wHTH) protein
MARAGVQHGAMRYAFNSCELDVPGRELKRLGQHVPIECQVFRVLVYLIEQRARVVPKRELLDALWSGAHVTESALGYSIAALRRATGDDGKRQAVVRTHHRVGYRFVAELAPGMPASPETALAPPLAAPASSRDPRCWLAEHDAGLFS